MKPTYDQLVEALRNMVRDFRPFTMKPIGFEGSAARIEQEEQIATHRAAKALLASLDNKGGDHVTAPPASSPMAGGSPSDDPPAAFNNGSR